MKESWLALLLLVFAPCGAGVEDSKETDSENDPKMPDWEEGELKDLESGDYVPGSSLIGRLAAESLHSDEEDIIELAETIRALPEDDEDGDDPEAMVIPGSFLAEYFHKEPGALLNDPQGLLTTQEFRDREGFLSYHVKDHEILFYLYLFDRMQKIPEGLALKDLVVTRFDPEKPAAVVFYFLGAPDRSQVVFTRSVTDPTGGVQRAMVLQPAIEAAGEMSEPSSQLEAFSMQLSARLSWLEEEVKNSGGNLSLAATVESSDSAIGGAGDRVAWWDRLAGNENLFWSVMGGGVVITAGLLGWLGRIIAHKRRAYLFPDAEGGTLMGAPYAAGVGGVLSFASAQTPPSCQESDVPDYLQRM